MPLRNVWSLEIGEVIAIELLHKHLGKTYEVFIPTHNRLKDYDLLLLNQLTKKMITIQVKASKGFDDDTGFDDDFGWFTVRKDKVFNEVVDFYICMISTLEPHKNTFCLKTQTLVIPAAILKERSREKIIHKQKGIEVYHYYFRITGNVAVDCRPPHSIDYSEYIENFNLLKC
jgi:hypothetical protein